MVDFAQKTDNDLVVLALADGENFLHLMQRYEEKLARYVRRSSGLCRESIEDVLQEVFLKTYRNLNAFDQGLKFSSWIYRIAHNEMVNYLKKNRGKETVDVDSDEEVGNLVDLLASEENVVQSVKKRELAEKVGIVMEGLKREYKEVLVLKFLEEKSYEEISDILEKPAGTVATLISRAKEQFRTLAQVYDLQSLIA